MLQQVRLLLFDLLVKGLQIYLSGLKGFHLLLDSRIFGKLAPARGLPALFDALRRHLAQEIAEAFARDHRLVDQRPYALTAPAEYYPREVQVV
jgi:hypothetical protein